MDPMLEEFRAVARGLTWNKPRIPIISTVAVGSDMTNPDYWVTHVREAVRFHDAIIETSATTFIELGPDGVLTAQAQQSTDGVFAAAIRKGHDEITSVLTAVGVVYTHGRLPALFGEAQRVSLPPYAFQRQRYWLTPAPRAPTSATSARTTRAIRCCAASCVRQAATPSCSPASSPRRRGWTTTPCSAP